MLHRSTTHRRLPWMSSLLLAVLVSTLAQAGVVQAAERICFTNSDFCIDGVLANFWKNNGGLAVFGMPITAQAPEDVEGKLIVVQWFERARLEVQNDGTVTMGRLGALWLERNGISWQDYPAESAKGGCQFFAETGHNVCGAILRHWRSNCLQLDGQVGCTYQESLGLWGLPLSGIISVTAGPNAERLNAQFFERARLEPHPENAPPYDVLGGLLGSELKNPAGWN